MDIKLFFTERGAGVVLIMLHGNGENGEYFAKQTDFFSRSLRVITPDTRGHGRSPRGSAPFTLRQFARDLYCFMNEHGIEKADILGFSDGANIALLFALEHPEMVRRLVLNGADLRPGGVRLTVQIPICAGWALACLLAPFSGKAAAEKEMLGLMVTQPHISPNSLAALTMPVLVIAGTRDMIRASHTRLIARSIPGSTLRLISGDHFIAAGNSGDFNREVSQFLTDNK